MKTKYCKFLSVCLLTTSSLMAQMQSTYTKVDHRACKVLNSHLDGYSSVSVCPSYADIKVKIIEDDSRQDMTLTHKGKTYNLAFREKISRAFSSFGSTVEWRFKEGKSQSPTAMIVRYIAADDYVDGLSKNVSYLVVTKITDTTICIVGKVPPGKDQNVQARNMSDRANTLSCVQNK